MLHQTDLFHPHADPDDHWDLACIYALAHAGELDLRGILIDYAPTMRTGPQPGDADLFAVGQMNAITGLAVPVAVGTPQPLASRDDTLPAAPDATLGGANLVLAALRSAPAPVAINIVGSCRDVALAGKRDPALFAEKCAGIYLNAGTGSPHPERAAQYEYNVALNAAAYAAIFDLPCPIYWMPCFEEITPAASRQVMEFGTFYKFRQADILDYLSPQVQNFFLYMLDRSPDFNWLRYLHQPPAAELLAKYGALDRNMWCTGGFLYAVGKTVLADGRIVARAQPGGEPVFSFDPIQVACDAQGVTTWQIGEQSPARYIFHVRDVACYQAAMTQAMKTLLQGLP
jgi:hypothetical protein